MTRESPPGASATLDGVERPVASGQRCEHAARSVTRAAHGIRPAGPARRASSGGRASRLFLSATGRAAIVAAARVGQDPGTAPVSIRIGGVPYGVGAPLLAGLESDPTVVLEQAPPTALIERLRAHQLDAALVSSIEAVRVPGYAVAAGLGIACTREIRSVRAFRRRGAPVRTIGLDESSATSAALLRLLLRGPRAADAAPPAEQTFTAIAPTRAPDALPHDLVLLIGDAGLQADAGAREVWDLGQQWRAWTDLPFVFALWVLHPAADPAAVLPVLHRARARGRELGPIDGTHGAAHYDLDADDVRGVHRFWAEARAAALATAADPRFLTLHDPAPR